jgi:hypothetical protein
MIPDILKKRFSNIFFHAKSNKKPDLTHGIQYDPFNNFWKKNNFQTLPISQKLDFYAISRFYAVRFHKKYSKLGLGLYYISRCMMALNDLKIAECFLSENCLKIVKK